MGLGRGDFVYCCLRNHYLASFLSTELTDDDACARTLIFCDCGTTPPHSAHHVWPGIFLVVFYAIFYEYQRSSKIRENLFFTNLN